MSINFKVCENIGKEEIYYRNFDIDNHGSSIFQNEIKEFKTIKSSFTKDLKLIEGYSASSFINTCWIAYDDHHHLEIRPDDIWMCIVTQFSKYVNKNSELLRDKFVDFQGKQTLELFVNGSPLQTLESQFDQISINIVELIQNSIIDPSIKDWLIPNFTTTTVNDKIAYSVAFISVMKPYTDIRLCGKCGLPEVTLNGTIDDWLNLKTRVLKLLDFNLSNTNEIKQWVDYLLPVTDKFIETAQGNPDTKWWNQIVDYRCQSGHSYLTGWLACFAVFNYDGVFRVDVEELHWLTPDEIEVFPYPKVHPQWFSNGFISAPIKLIGNSSSEQYKEINCEIYSGHFAVKVDEESKTRLSPSIDWVIVQKNK